MKTTLEFSWNHVFKLDVYIDGTDNVQCLHDYVVEVMKNKKDYILKDMIDGKNNTRIGLNINLAYLEDEDRIEILNEDEIISTIDELEDLAGLAE